MFKAGVASVTRPGIELDGDSVQHVEPERAASGRPLSIGVGGNPARQDKGKAFTPAAHDGGERKGDIEPLGVDELFREQIAELTIEGAREEHTA